MVAEEGLEPSRSFEQRILSPLCLPIPPFGLNCNFLMRRRNILQPPPEQSRRMVVFVFCVCDIQ